jgi:hypothetical protein
MSLAHEVAATVAPVFALALIGYGRTPPGLLAVFL